MWSVTSTHSGADTHRANPRACVHSVLKLSCSSQEFPLAVRRCRRREGDCSGRHQENVLHWFRLRHRAQILTEREYFFTAAAEREIVQDVIKKLRITTQKRPASSQTASSSRLAPNASVARKCCSSLVSSTCVTVTPARTCAPTSCSQVARPYAEGSVPVTFASDGRKCFSPHRAHTHCGN